MRILLILLALSIAAPCFGAYGYYMPYTIDHAKVSASQSDFPVLLKKTSNNLKVTGSGGHVTSSSGFDIAVFSDTALTTAIPCEAEAYDGTAGTVSIWVKIASLSSSSDTTVYIAYGDSSKTTQQCASTSVWDSYYKEVLHFPVSSGTVTAKDSSASAHADGAVTGTTALAGKIGGAVSFNGSSDKITVPYSTDFNMNLTAHTFEAWVYTASTNFQVAFALGSESTVLGWQFGLPYDGGTSLWTPQIRYNNYGSWVTNSATKVSGSAWHHIQMACPGTFNSTAIVVIDGSSVGSAQGCPGDITGDPSTLSLTLGANSTPQYWYSGRLDEVRISKGIARSATWGAVSYANQNDPDTFGSLGAEVSVGGSRQRRVIF